MTPSPLALPFVDALVRQRARTYLEFAEQEFVLPSGPRRGARYTADFMPFSSEVLEEFGRGRFTDFFGSGPVQSGKTTHFYTIPALYHLFELGEDVIFGAPTTELAKSIFDERMLPTIRASRYRDLLPRFGAGSKGGTPDSVLFRNGARARFLGAGGGDQQIASYTARVVVATELDKMDTPGKVSREADPVSKLKARTRSFGRAARFFGECTMTTKAGRIYQEVVELGTDSRVHLPCPHCRTWILPERKLLIGWQEAANELEARERARLACPACGQHWTESDRRKAIRDPRVVARGQSVDSATGAVVGELPPTLTYGFRWNAVASPLVSLADMAAQEWRKDRVANAAAEKEIVQYTWAEPWEESIEDLNRPDVETILRKISAHPRKSIPPGTLRVTLGMDVGSYVIWWVLVAWFEGAAGHVADFGSIDVPLTNGVKNPTSVLAALRSFRDSFILPGWGGRQPDMTLIDSGYEQDVVYQFVRESGEPRFLACKGYGTSSRHGLWKSAMASEQTDQRGVGHEWRYYLQPSGVHLVVVHSDHWKAAVHDGFAAAGGAPGSLTLFEASAQEQAMRIFARQIVAEQRQLAGGPGKEQRVVWVVHQKQNHYLDTAAYARCAADMLGIKLGVPVGAPPAPKDRRVIVNSGPGARPIRRVY